MSMASLWRVLLPLIAVTALTGCENSAVAYSIDGNREALIFVREQRWFWSGALNQYVVVSRLPDCQRRVKIHPGSTDALQVEVFEAGDRLWALQQGERWYLASTAKCLVQDWTDAPAAPPGRKVGSFVLRDGAPAFVGAQASEK
jgi:hypothetical protein